MRWPFLAALTFMLPAAAIAAAMGNGPVAGSSDAGVFLSPSDAGNDKCRPLEERIARRMAWLAARRQEQFERGGPPDPTRGIPNVIGLWCEQHLEDENCRPAQTLVEVDASELAWSPEKTPEDYEPEVVLLKRELIRCRTRPMR